MAMAMSGLNYERTPIALRERLGFTRARTAELVAAIYAAAETVDGCAVISTCNRTEIYLTGEVGALEPARLLCDAAEADYAEFEEYFETRRDESALYHLCAVSSGLRSQIWGEDQIISQVRDAILISRESGSADAVLETLFRTAVSAGKAVKTRIHLVNVPRSAAAGAILKLERVIGGLENKRAMVVGNGEMGRLTAKLLTEAGAKVTVTLRTYRHGETVVPAGCDTLHYDRRFELVPEIDLLISATTSPHYTVTAEQLEGLERLPGYMVDLAIPRDISPDVGELEGVTLFNIDDLATRKIEHGDPPEVREVLDEHIARFNEWLNYRDALPVMQQVKGAITERLILHGELDGADSEEAVRIAVARTVELLSGTLKDSITPERLQNAAVKIRAGTRGKIQNGAESYVERV